MTRLVDTINLGTLKVKNRIVMPPMATNKATRSGEVTQSQIKHYVEHAQDVGLIIAEHSYVTPPGRFSSNQLGIYDENLIPGLYKLTSAVHSCGTPIAAQISHAGARAQSSVIRTQPLGPSSVLVFQEIPKELTTEQIDKLVESFGQSAQRAVQAGFDTVEIHGAHGFLLNQFLSPLTNKREDEFGGTFENRARFPLQVVNRVRREVGNDFPLLYRLGADDFRQGGLSLADTKTFAGLLVDAGVNAIDVSNGIDSPNPPKHSLQGFLLHLAEGIKKAVDVPVIGVGGIKDAEFADQAVREGKVDLMAVGRALYADPKWATKAIKTLMHNETYTPENIDTQKF